MLEAKDMEYQEKLPSKEERKAINLQQEEDVKNTQIIKELCREFVNEKLISLAIPVFLVEEIVDTVMKPLITIHKAKSLKYQEYLKAKEAMETENMNEIEYVVA
jgi:biopolymer transport protein ExbD